MGVVVVVVVFLFHFLYKGDFTCESMEIGIIEAVIILNT